MTHLLQHTIHPLSFHPDKWNPGDIWMESVGATEKPLVEEKFYKTWPALNAEVQRLAKKGNVLGKWNANHLPDYKVIKKEYFNFYRRIMHWRIA